MPENKGVNQIKYDMGSGTQGLQPESTMKVIQEAAVRDLKGQILLQTVGEQRTLRGSPLVESRIKGNKQHD